MKIVIIGSGNVATVLGRRIRAANHTVLQVFSRSEQHAARLAEELGAGFTANLKKIDEDGDCYLAALSDTALASLAGALSLGDRLVVHTAGALSKDILKGVSTSYGVLYPLQSLRREIPAVREIPLLIDGNSVETTARIRSFAGTLSSRVQIADDLTRIRLHIGAVFVNNFTNHLFRIAEDYCRREQVDFSLLLPLIVETANRLADFSPRELQTGPAVRNDRATIERHLSILDNDLMAMELYGLFTKQIQAVAAQDQADRTRIRIDKPGSTNPESR